MKQNPVITLLNYPQQRQTQKNKWENWIGMAKMKRKHQLIGIFEYSYPIAMRLYLKTRSKSFENQIKQENFENA